MKAECEQAYKKGYEDGKTAAEKIIKLKNTVTGKKCEYLRKRVIPFENEVERYCLLTGNECIPPKTDKEVKECMKNIIMEHICDDYCRFPRELKSEYDIEEKCFFCPLNKMFGGVIDETD